MDLYKIETTTKKYINSFLLLALLLVTLSFSMPLFAYDQPWNGNREDITSAEDNKDDNCPSGNCDECGKGSPVYLADGSLAWDETDIVFSSDTNVSLKRTYNSFDQRAGLFGRGWVTAQESNIARTYKALDAGNADGSPSTATNFGPVPIWLASYGRRYKLQESATACTPPGIFFFTFEKQANGNFKQIFEDNQSYSVYDANGKLLQSYSDKEGSSVYYVYDTQDRLTQQYDSYGFTLNFTYNDQGFVSQVTDQGSRSWIYTYDTSGRLTQLLDPDGNTRDYGYQTVDNIGYKKDYLNSINDNGTEPVLSVTWANRTIGTSTKLRVTSYTEVDGKRNDYSYLRTTYNGVAAVRVIKDTKQVGTNTTIERKTYYVDASNYRKLSTINNTDNLTETKTYDSRGKISSILDKRGNTTDYIYNAVGRVTKITELAGTAEAKEINITYWNNTDRVATRNEYGLRETRYTYDTSLRVLTKTLVDLGDNSQRITSYTYYPNTTDSLGNVVLGKLQTIDGPQAGAGDLYTLQYNSQGLVSRVNMPQGLFFDYGYNSSMQLASVTNSNNIVTKLSYNSDNKVVQADTNGRISKASYNSKGLLTQYTDPLNRSIAIQYSTQNKPSRITYPSGDYTDVSYVYNSSYTEVQQRYYQMDGTLFSTQVERKDVISEKTLGSFLEATTKQVFQNQLNGLDELQQQTRFGQFGVSNSSLTTYGYDTEGRLSLEQNTDGNTNYIYNKLGQLTQITDTNNASTQYTNTAWGELRQLTSPDTGLTQYQVNASGELSSSINANNQQTIYSYDGLNRLIQIDYEGAALDIQLNYDEGTNGNGHLTSATDESGSTQFQYDSRGLATLISSNIAGSNYVTGYSFNDADELTNITYPSGIVVSYTYDTAGRISGLQLDNSGTISDIVSSITWKGNQLGSYLYGNNLKTDYLYDSAGRLVEKQYGSLSNRFQNQLDNQGNITSQNWTRVGAQSTNAYEYDQMSRLTKDSEASLNLALTYGYDSIGNRIIKQEANSGESITYQYEPNSNRLSTINANSIQRDNTGNILTDGNRTYQYNTSGRLSQSNNILSGMQGNYTYNFLGQRVRKQLSGSQIDDIRYVYDSANNNRLLGEYDASGTRVREYIYLNNADESQLVAQIESDGTIHYIHTDHLDSPRLASNQNQTFIWRWDSDAFGEEQANEDLDGNGSDVVINLRFPGQYYDLETGLQYNYFRDYDPSTGRYVQSDPIGLEGGLNTYGYVDGNPLYWSDPYGLFGVADLPKVPDSVTNSIAGFGDSVSFNLTKAFRDAAGIGGVNKCSDSYKYGNYAGTAFGLGGAAKTGFNVYKGLSRAKKWRSNSRTSRRTRDKKISEAGTYRDAIGDATLSLIGGSGVDSYSNLLGNSASGSSSSCGCEN